MRPVSRRVFSLAATGILVAPRLAWAGSGKVPKSLDHIILSCNDFDAGVEYVYQRTGVRAAPDEVHPAAGTKNALLSRGRLRYLEIIAPDPLQPAPTDPRHLAKLMNPALVGWALHRRDLKPNPAEIRALSAKLQLDARIRQSKEARLAATVAGPKGSLQLHSR